MTYIVKTFTRHGPDGTRPERFHTERSAIEWARMWVRHARARGDYGWGARVYADGRVVWGGVA